MSILRRFVETKCEACGYGKPLNTAFCKDCYYKLPHNLRAPLWRRLGGGFEDAYTAALDWLKPVEAKQ